jgi:hypothetical protein
MGGKGETGGVAGSQPMSIAVHRSPNKLWRANSIFHICFKYIRDGALIKSTGLDLNTFTFC